MFVLVFIVYDLESNNSNMTEETNAGNRDSAGTATGSEDGPAISRSLKVTVVGDSGTGKTCMLMAFANNKFPDDDICCQSLFENSKGTIRGIK